MRAPAAQEPTEPSVEAPRRSWREVLDLGDRRGLTALGALLVLLLLGGAGGLYDGVTGTGLRTAFAVGFVTGCGLAAALVRRPGLRAVLVMPPLAFVVLAVAQSVVGRLAGSGFTVDRQAIDVVNAVVLGAPVMVGGTLLVLAVALVRWLLDRRR